MRVHLGSDHAGLDLKTALTRHLTGLGHEPVDHGPSWLDPLDDYPPFVLRAAAAVAAEPGSLGVVIGGSGNGEAIAANKVAGVRCALAWSAETASLGRLHNDANVVSVGARMHDLETALALVDVFLTTDYSGEERHGRRIAMLTAYERTGALPPLPGAPDGPAPDGPALDGPALDGPAAGA
jgi:ribose 5-phosphate isomerase B